MKAFLTAAHVAGRVVAPSSKSHTIRALVAALLAEGPSTIVAPLRSHDTDRAVAACRACGATVTETAHDATYTVRGVGGAIVTGEGAVDSAIQIDVGNSGTTLRLFTAIAALSTAPFHFDGDAQIRARPMAPLLQSLVDLGATVQYHRAHGHAPFTIRGAFTGGKTHITCHTSQYLSALLLATPCAAKESTIVIDRLEERPYIEMTLQWLRRCGISYTRQGDLHYHIEGGQRYRPFACTIEGDYSSATFLLCAAALTGHSGGVRIENLLRHSVQGDRGVVRLLARMGVPITTHETAVIVLDRSPLRGGRFDLNSMPDALPALMVCACCAEQSVVIYNVAHARIKETDRIAVMSAELRKMGARIAEHADGVTIYPTTQRLRGAHVNGHGDHRVVMALAVAALVATGETVITDAEAVAITYPHFFSEIEKLTAKKIKLIP